jgi:phosphopantothenate-cysteine ligase
MAKILITSGGTKVRLDEVRHIGNMSSGRFGAEIAKAALRAGHQVIFLYAKGSVRPDEVTLNLGHGNTIRTLSNILTDNDLVWGVKNLLTVDEYRDFDDYAAKLQAHLVMGNPDVTMLAAAVSDYGMAAKAGKISSDKDTITFTLKRLPKLIAKVKEWCPTTFLVGFKLLVDSDNSAKSEAAEKQMSTAGSDLVVVNDLRDIKTNNHALWVFWDPGCCHVLKGDAIAGQLVKEIFAYLDKLARMELP